jgi:hypothetical protein
LEFFPHLTTVLHSYLILLYYFKALGAIFNRMRMRSIKAREFHVSGDFTCCKFQSVEAVMILPDEFTRKHGPQPSGLFLKRPVIFNIEPSQSSYIFIQGFGKSSALPFTCHGKKRAWLACPANLIAFTWSSI